ncbi:MAG: hypothetical protein QN122_07540 [Armatimonadota bacterium]|nr:hypothetical protein [Armatimonadota bacterium]MDR7449283.1 hypothetical protein [Armatimonadota bacterium]MDR7459653.1 hypothetical protein [Armatimonadota bacterium]MDR7480593.1 hypothetical protein [Armatimonadota bacterium]MDR7489289.1 hypothetical protein [Armatimonadota bacterium]
MRVLAAAVALVIALAPTPALAGPKGPKVKVKTYVAGEAFCPTAALVYGTIVISPGTCYTLFLVGERGGTFLAFAPAGVKIPPGQLVRLTTPAGAKLRGRFLYLVPVSAPVALVAVGTATLVAVRAEDLGSRLTLTLVGVAAPNVVVSFSVRL